MAEYEVAEKEIGAHHKKLVADTVDTVEFARDLRRVRVVTDGAAEIFVTVDGDDPELGDSAAYYLPAIPCVEEFPAPSGAPTTVKLRSSGTPTYGVSRPA
jgi:hypothetical protein